MREVRRSDVVIFVVLSVVDFPPFLFRSPFVDSADESVNGGVVDEVGDKDRVSLFDRRDWRGRGGFLGSSVFDRLGLIEWGGAFEFVRFWVLVGFVVRVLWRGWGDLFESFVCFLFALWGGCLLSVDYTLSDAIGCVL